MRIVYLHGFASSPRSGKAQFFLGKFRDAAVAMQIPQLDQGDFERLTISGQLDVIDREVGGEPAVLMGSSLGGYLAALYAARHPEIERLVLMAPAFQFASRWRSRFTPQQLEQWRDTGSLPFFHYGYNRDANLGYQFVEDAAKFEEEPEFHQPTLIFHGSHDQVVPLEVSQAMANRHSNLRLRVLPSGHELTDVVDQMWSETAEFLGLG